MDTVKHCLIVEDHGQAREWLARAVSAAFPTASQTLAMTVKEAKQAIDHQLPDLALVDLGLPDGSGHTLIKLLDTSRNTLREPVTIVVSTVMNDDESIFSAIRAGADGYILKEEDVETLTDMLQGIYASKPPLSPEIASRLLKFFRPEQPEQDPLAPRERQILQLLAKGFTVQKVADMLGITYNTTASYVRDIYRKLNVTSRAEATLEASKRGLV